MKGIQVCLNENSLNFPRLDNYKIATIHWSFPPKPNGNFNQTWHKTSLDKGNSNCSNEGPRPFQKRDNYEIVKVHWRNLRIFFSRTTRPISTKLGTKGPWVKGIQGITNIEHSILQKEIWFFSISNHRYDMTIPLLKCVYWFELVSQVSDVAHVLRYYDLLKDIITIFKFLLHVLW